ncbi:unnamed protein product [Symbiodinium natans]|uniref:Uncharacterized protein n=1 Tax=Symbiodinium natans TaxID=878477 RepID=A0A812KF76_9DINO|nr:unnamed protein product [Symbiodinium natans]
MLDALVAQCNTGVEELRSLWKCLHWTQPLKVLQFMHKYLASRFLWFAPILDPTVHTQDVVRVLQVVVLTKFLHLCIPAELAHTEAMVVHRLRKRACYCLLHAHKVYSWVYALIIRKFTYMGHLLRRPSCHLARRLMLAGYRDFSSGKPGPWRSHLHWLVQTVSEVFDVEMPLLRPDSANQVAETLAELASHRDEWHARSLRLYDRDLMPLHLFSASPWASWRKPLTSHVPWWFCGYMWLHDDGFRVVWLDRQEGFQVFTFGVLTAASIDLFVAYTSMQRPYFTLTLLITADFVDAYRHQLVDIHNACMQSRSVVVLYEEVPDSWIRKACGRSHEC